MNTGENRQAGDDMTVFHDFNATTLQGKEISMEQYRGKVVLVVNTASKCGFTPQYEGLQELHQKYKDQGLVILGFPCNQFGKQEPGTSKEIGDFCRINYGVTFQMFEKIDVNGKDAHPIYVYLKDELPGTLSKKIKWNFTKFLVDHEGLPYKRFSSSTKPEKLVLEIEALLKNTNAQ
jgi:glutathione peroxidase